jgi:hypothetical protein
MHHTYNGHVSCLWWPQQLTSEIQDKNNRKTKVTHTHTHIHIRMHMQVQLYSVSYLLSSFFLEYSCTKPLLHTNSHAHMYTYAKCIAVFVLYVLSAAHTHTHTNTHTHKYIDQQHLYLFLYFVCISWYSCTKPTNLRVSALCKFCRILNSESPCICMYVYASVHIQYVCVCV